LAIIIKYRVFLAQHTGLNGKNLLPITQAYHVIALATFLKCPIRHDYQTLEPEKIELPKAKSQSIKFLNISNFKTFAGFFMAAAETVRKFD